MAGFGFAGQDQIKEDWKDEDRGYWIGKHRRDAGKKLGEERADRLRLRNPQSDQMKKLVEGIEGRARAGTVSDAAAASEILLLATPWGSAETALRSAGDLTGKILIDATNPLIVPSLEGLSLGTTTSAGEMVGQWAYRRESGKGLQHRRLLRNGETEVLAPDRLRCFTAATTPKPNSW